MADQLNMNGLSLGGQAETRSYIPPHMRAKMNQGGPHAANGGPPPAGINGSAWAPSGNK